MNSQSPQSLQSLNSDVLQTILSYLLPKDLRALRLTSSFGLKITETHYSNKIQNSLNSLSFDLEVLSTSHTSLHQFTELNDFLIALVLKFDDTALKEFYRRISCYDNGHDTFNNICSNISKNTPFSNPEFLKIHDPKLYYLIEMIKRNRLGSIKYLREYDRKEFSKVKMIVYLTVINFNRMKIFEYLIDKDQPNKRNAIMVGFMCRQNKLPMLKWYRDRVKYVRGEAL